MFGNIVVVGSNVWVNIAETDGDIDLHQVVKSVHATLDITSLVGYDVRPPIDESIVFASSMFNVLDNMSDEEDEIEASDLQLLSDDFLIVRSRVDLAHDFEFNIGDVFKRPSDADDQMNVEYYISSMQHAKMGSISRFDYQALRVDLDTPSYGNTILLHPNTIHMFERFASPDTVQHAIDLFPPPIDPVVASEEPVEEPTE